jgi:uncharacterized damage-inducible protein DinB
MLGATSRGAGQALRTSNNGKEEAALPLPPEGGSPRAARSMAEENPTLSTFYASWKQYQDHLKEALAPLTAEQLTLRAAPSLRTLGKIATHIIGTRTSWFTRFLGEEGEIAAALKRWDDPNALAEDAAELMGGLDLSWNLMADALSRWSPADMQQTFGRDRRGNHYELSRSWVVWHVLEHDLHHGGEISLTLGMHGLQAPDI